MDPIIILLSLAFLAFSGFFLFKQLEFVLKAINLYKKMITQQDIMIKLLKDIRGPGNYQDESKIIEKPLHSSRATQPKVSNGHHHWGENEKTHNVVKRCPKCNGTFHGAEFESCSECNCTLV